MSGPVVDLGTTDDLDAFAIVHPRDTTLATSACGSSSTEHLRAASTSTTCRHRGRWTTSRSWRAACPAWTRGGCSPGSPGLYRLDLLIEPEDVVRSVMLTVRTGASGAGGTASRDGEPTRTTQSFQPSTLRMLPEAANLWSSGRILSGWRRAEADATCARGRDLARDGSRWIVLAGPPRADGRRRRQPPSEVVTSIGLLGIDPLPGPVDADARLAVDGLPGRAIVRAPMGGLPDGIYPA